MTFAIADCPECDARQLPLTAGGRFITHNAATGYKCAKSGRKPPTAKTRSEIGRSANARGKTYERQLAAYLRSWWPDAERAVAVGFATRAQRASADPGDIRGVPGVIWDCKSRQQPLSHQQRANLLVELIGKARANGAAFAILVERRERAQVADWIATIAVQHLTRLAAGPFVDAFVITDVAFQPVSMRLADAVTLLRTYGVG